MEAFYENNTAEHKPWKKALCVLLSVIIAFGTLIALTVGSSRLQDWLGMRSMLSAYAAEIVDTSDAVAANEDEMLSDHHIIDLENKDGSNTVYLFSEPISYTDENGNLKTKDISVEKQTDRALKNAGYAYTNGQNDYRINFSEDPSTGLQVQFDGSTYSIIPRGDKEVTGKKNTAEFLNEEFEVFEYPDFYGTGTTLRFYPQLNGVKEEIVLNTNIGQNTFSFKIATENCTAVLNDDGTVSLLDKDGNAVQTFAAPFAYDSAYVEGDYDAHYSPCTYALTQEEDGSYILTVTVSEEWLHDENTVYPVVIDPTTSNITNSKDAGVYSAKSSNNYGSEQTACFGRASEYGYGRVYAQFTVPSAIKKGATINSAYYWARETTGRTTTTYVTPYMVTGSWSETGIKWSNKPGYNSSVAGTKKNINSKSKDDPDNVYWYKFDLKNAVKKWVDGTANNGVVFVSNEETNKAYNWRAFTSRTYSSSAMRPYTVINYTNDATAPTITSVTGNPTAWTNGNVTLTVNGAADNSGGSGLHSTPYSFSTTKGSYSWQASKSKTFSANGTVYVYVRDAQGNIRLASTQTISKIDKTAPSAPTVSGNPTSWTNQDVTLTASSSDSASGVKYYSFSTAQGTYSWQTAATKTFSAGGTVYVYAKDAAGNVSAATTVSLSKVDKTAPVISNVSVAKNSTGGTVTITASDSQSGVAAYSFDGGTTWQSGNSKTYSTLPGTVSAAVKDNAGNVAKNVAGTVLPEFYTDGALIGLADPSVSGQKMQYKIGANGTWTDYTVPFAVPAYQEVTVYARLGTSGTVSSKTVKPNKTAIGTYSESAADFSLAYRGVSFDFVRSYDSTTGWFFATDSRVTKQSDSLLSVLMPDGSVLPFVKTGADTFKNELNGYVLTSGQNQYILKAEGVQYTFGADGYLTSVRNVYDDVITITRSASAIKVADETGRTYTLALNASGRVTKVTDPAGGVITYTYDTSGNLTKVVDQAGVTLGQYSYTSGLLTKSLDKTIKYDSDGRVTGYVYDSGAYVNYTYNDAKKTVSTAASDETTTSETYNDAFLTVSSTDAEGNTTEYTYDDYFRVLTETSDGATTTYTYDANGRVISEFSDDDEAENTYYTYDSAGNVIRQQSGDTYTYSVYDANGELTLSATLKEDYKGDPPAAYDASLTCFDTVTYTYDGGLLTKSVDSKASETIVYVYDKYGNTAKTTSSKIEDGETTVTATDYTYDLFGNVLTSTSGEEKSSYIYDAAGRTLLANEKGECTRTLYDSLGRTIQQIEPQDYDAAKDGLPSKNTYADPKAGHTYVYAENGTLTSETNRLGKTTTYQYNEKGNKIRETFDIYQFNYYDHGELGAVFVAGEIKALYLYDKNYNLTNEAYTNGQSIQYKYDADGNLTGQYKNNSKTPYITYSYDSAGELVEKTEVDTGLRYEYGSDDSVSVYRIEDDTLVYSYVEESSDDDLTTVTETHWDQVYTYERRDKTLQYTQGSLAAYGHITTGSGDNRKVTGSLVTTDGLISLVSGYAYDDDHNVTQKQTAVGGTTLSFTNTYDEKNRITSATTPSGTAYYTYDAQGQLVREDDSTTGITTLYSYDNRGNMVAKDRYAYTRETPSVKKSSLSMSYATDGWKDQLVKAGGLSVTYDAMGNMLTYGNWELRWENGRQLQSVADGGLEISYTYDDSGIRTSKTVDGVTTYYQTNGGVITGQTDGENTFYFQYDLTGAPFGFVLNGTQYYYVTNQMGDVMGITDANKNLLAQYAYNAWGEPTVVRTADGFYTDLAELNPIRYRGYYYDTDTQWYYLQSRYYDPNLCRFINADKFSMTEISMDDLHGLNLYLYCNNDPINYEDFSGTRASNRNYSVTVYYYQHTFGTAKLKNPFGHMDISFGGKTYSYGQYKVKNKSANFFIANTASYLRYQKNSKKSGFKIKKQTTIHLTRAEYNRLNKYYSSLSKTRIGSSDKFSGTYYKIKSGKYKTYKVFNRNCSTMVLDALEYAMPATVKSTVTQYVRYLGTLNTPYYVSLLVGYMKSKYKL